MMEALPYLLIAVPAAFLLYSYLVYPAVLKLGSLFVPAPVPGPASGQWPMISITVPCFNEERSIAATLESILALDYPAERRQVLVISDASTDQTDEIVRAFASRGVELLTLPVRKGKTGAENAATPHLRGDVVLNTDATIRILPGALKRLVAAFEEPDVGVASGRDISVGSQNTTVQKGESGYVGYEMWVRSLETRLGGIVGASGCFFASRRLLHAGDFPESLSRDFASCIIAHERGYRAVSVDAAQCLVPRASSLRAEFHRKVRTMARGLETLLFKRVMLNPFRHGWFSMRLFSHKLSRWLGQLTVPLAVGGLLLLAVQNEYLRPAVAGLIVFAVLAAVLSWHWPEGRPMPAVLSVPGFLIWAHIAGFLAWWRFLGRRHSPIWEPTRRAGIASVPGGGAKPRSPDSLAPGSVRPSGRGQ